MAYATDNNPQVTQALLALSVSSNIATISLPDGELFKLTKGYAIDSMSLGGLVQSAAKGLNLCPEAKLHKLPSETKSGAKRRRLREHQSNSAIWVRSFINQLNQQWPCLSPLQPTGLQMETYVDVASAMDAITPQWRATYENLKFKTYLDDFFVALKKMPLSTFPIPSFFEPRKLEPTSRPPGFMSTCRLFFEPPPAEVPVPPQILSDLIQTTTEHKDSCNLIGVLSLLDSRAKFYFEGDYLAELRSSLSTLQTHINSVATRWKADTLGVLFQWHLELCMIHVEATYKSLSQATCGLSKAHSPASADAAAMIRNIAFEANFWPRISPILFLQQLAKSRWKYLPDAWKNSIVTYGRAITALQQAKRLVQFQENKVDLLKELENMGPKG
ncbi:hypothetical protein QQZ08_006778 [Neonectria magnoliae]|uniref:Uncharacterized protein n=1 Tax=Neonectria magnoliae TaxID=2732573 RepID=A0ABR1I1A5_9HYPO